jgi:hypothetical protein
MLNLSPNSPTEQFIYVTAQDIEQAAGGDTYTLVFSGSMSQAQYSFTPRIVQDNPRYTTLGVFTNEQDPNNGKILIEETGEFTYELYRNRGIDTLLIEVGSLHVNGTFDPKYYEPQTDNIIYYE